MKRLLEDGVIRPGKYWLSPDAELQRCDDHETSAWALLSGYGIENEGQDDSDMTWAYTELHKRGWIRVVVTDDSILMTGPVPVPAQNREMRNQAIEARMKLLFDYGGKERVVYDPNYV